MPVHFHPNNPIDMVISEPSEINQYEIFVGITRAMLNVKINIVQ